MSVMVYRGVALLEKREAQVCGCTFALSRLIGHKFGGYVSFCDFFFVN